MSVTISLGQKRLKYLSFVLNIFEIIFLTLFLHGCTPKENIPPYQKKMVIDGWIESGSLGRVLLTFTSPYFTEIDSFSIKDYLASRAKVTIFGASNAEIMIFKPSKMYFPPNIYQSTFLKGQINQNYRLEVIFEGDTLRAETYIPSPPKIDTAYFVPVSSTDTLGYIQLSIRDNPDTDDYYRIFSTVQGNDERFRPILVPNYSDELFKGKNIDIPVYQGNLSNLTRDDQLYFDIRDTVILKVCTMNYDAYKYWVTFQQAYNNSGNPLASGGRALSTNIKGGLGIWCGYGVTRVVVYPR